MGFYHQEDCDGWTWDEHIKFEPSEPSQETDLLGFTYINKPDRLEKNENTNG